MQFIIKDWKQESILGSKKSKLNLTTAENTRELRDEAIRLSESLSGPSKPYQVYLKTTKNYCHFTINKVIDSLEESLCLQCREQVGEGQDGSTENIRILQ